MFGPSAMEGFLYKYTRQDKFWTWHLGKTGALALKSIVLHQEERTMINVDSFGRVLMEAVSISPSRPKDSALQTWTRVEYKKDQAYATRELKSGRLPQEV